MAKKRKEPEIRFKGFTDVWEQSKLGESGTFYYGHSCPKWSVTKDAKTPCIRYGELYTKFGTKIDKVYSYTNMPSDKLRFSKGTEVLVPRVGEDPMDYNHCTWLSMPNVAIGEMISVYNTDHNPLFTAIMFNATLQEEFAQRVEGGTVTNLYYDKLKNIDVCFPSIEEQEKIASYFEKIDNLITLHQRKYDKLIIVKKSMLEKMFPKDGRNVPEIRFSGFTDPWEQRKLSEIADKVNEKNVNFAVNETFTNSAEYGVISQRDFFDHDIFNLENINGYYVVGEDDFVYNPRISATALVGPINRNKLGRKGVMSPLYTVFKTHDIDSTFLEYFFKGNGWHSYMFFNGDTGARFDRFSIKNEVFFDMPIPYPKIEEQKSIGRCLENLDSLIMLHQRRLEKLRNIKSSCMKKMFV